MDRITRKELKKDAFAREVGHTVEYLGEHSRQLTRYGAVALAIVLLGGGFYFYNHRRQTAREKALGEAMEILQAPVGPSSANQTVKTYATPQDKYNAASKALSAIADKDPGTEEGVVAKYLLGTMAADQGRLEGASKLLKEAADSKYANYASLAKLSLAQVYAAQGNLAESEKLLRSLIDKPTILVSKQQATIALARILASTKPEEARKLLEPLRLEAGPAARTAFSILNTLPNKS